MKGILFKPDMIRAIAEGKKSQTRRLSGLKEINQEPDEWICRSQIKDRYYFEIPFTTTCHLLIKPRYQVGEVVYIKEAWVTEQVLDNLSPAKMEYASDVPIWYKTEEPIHTTCVVGKWRSPLFMPEWAARYFIKILDVRPERLQEITLSDIEAEGHKSFVYPDGIQEIGTAEFFRWYMDLWDFINPKYSWSHNPWVWRYEFEKIKRKEGK